MAEMPPSTTVEPRMRLILILFTGMSAACSPNPSGTSGEREPSAQTESVQAQGRGHQETAGKAGRDVVLIPAVLSTAPPGPSKGVRGTFQGTEPCLYFQDWEGMKYLVAFTSPHPHWDPKRKGLVLESRTSAPEREIFKPGQWVTIVASRANLEDLAGRWAAPPDPACLTQKVWVARKVYYTMAQAQAIREQSAG